MAVSGEVASITPPTFVERIGFPPAWASIKLTGVPSLLDVRQITSEPAIGSSISCNQDVNVSSAFLFLW